MGIIDSALERPCCANCFYWRPSADGHGSCHRHAPKFSEGTAAMWFQTESDDWCGDHERT